MKTVNIILVIILFVMAGCGGGNQSTDDLIVVDVTKANYPKKELILQDFMDVEYVALETNDDFLNQGFVQAIGRKFIFVINPNDDGDIFVYDRTGKALRKINRKGQNSEEYIRIFNITLDEDDEEFFVNNLYKKEILVYDLYGNFKRSFKHKEDTKTLGYRAIFNYDRNNLICCDEFNEEIPFVLISKKDGSITKEIIIPFKEKKLLQQIRRDGENTNTVSPGPYRSIIPFKGDWMLFELSSDTVFQFLPDYNLRPYLVRAPSVQSMNPEVFLLLRFLSNSYYFMETIKNVYDFNTNDGFPKTFMMYDKMEKAIFNYSVYNSDYSIKKEIYFNLLRPVNHEIESWQALQAYRLVDDYKKGILKGKLKEIAATLDEDDNPVIMLIKHKK